MQIAKIKLIKNLPKLNILSPKREPMGVKVSKRIITNTVAADMDITLLEVNKVLTEEKTERDVFILNKWKI